MQSATPQPTIHHPPTGRSGLPAQANVPPGVWLARVAIASVFLTVIAGAVSLMGLAGYAMNYRGLIYPGVSAWGVDLSGKTPAAAAEAMSIAFAYPSSSAFEFTDPETGRSWAATPAQLGLTFDLPASVQAAYGLGRSGNLFVDAWDQFNAWYFGVQVSPVVVYDQDKVLFYLNNVAEEVYRPVVEASLAVDGATVTTTPGQIGRQLDVLATAAAVRAPLMSMGGTTIPLVMVETPPLVLDASPQAADAQAILREPLTLTLENPVEGDPGPWTIDQATLAGMLQVRRVEDGPNAAHYEVGLDPAALMAQLQPLAEPLARKSENARFVFSDETRQLELIGRATIGRELDLDATLARIQEALLNDAHSVPLVIRDLLPAVTDDATAEQLGITQLVSEQTTYFTGSSVERVRNIQVASERYHGLLVAPNATFSFNEHLGDVSLDTGFAEALIIYGGRTIRGVGGGVCQVSTTLFRAVYFGGFPFVERYSHAYRVSYYERGDTWRGPGLDATVYSPIVDFKFTNDSPNWLLMEVYVSPGNGSMTWRFYSTSDGRQVTVSPPEVSNVVPAPEPLYEEDASLAAGQIKQVDYAADGADVVVRRTITRDGVQVNSGEPPVTTQYAPWRAVFNYGPGTQGIPGQ